VSLSDASKTKALEFALEVYQQANPAGDTSPGGMIRAALIVPFSLIYAAVFQLIEQARVLYLGNFAAISEEDMDLLAGNILEERDLGSFSTTTLEVFLKERKSFTLQPFPYFSTSTGTQFQPIDTIQFSLGDILDRDGELFVTVPVISVSIGSEASAGEGEIQVFSNMPVRVDRVTNPQATVGGDTSQTNAEFFEELSVVSGEDTTVTDGGVTAAALAFEAEEVLVVSAGEDMMLRDELWTVDEVIPNLTRDGRPFAVHTPLTALDFDKCVGRAFSPTGEFTEEMEGERIEVEGDTEKFRLVLRVVDENTAVLSGHELTGVHDALIYGQGEHVRTMSDVYMYLPTLEVRSQIVDKRFFVQPLFDQGPLSPEPTKLYFKIAEGFTFDTFPDSGILIFGEGTDQERRFIVLSVEEDLTGDYFQLDSALTIDLVEADILTIYDMEEIIISTEGDIERTPVIYILRVDALDPQSFELAESIPRTIPGNFAVPGFYLSNTDPAEVFSAREDKTLVLDEKRGLNAFVALNEPNCSVTSTLKRFEGLTEIPGTKNVIAKVFDWTDMEGREIVITTEDLLLQGDSSSVVAADITSPVSPSTNTATIDGLDIRYLSSIGYRDDVRVEVFDSGAGLLQKFEPGLARVFGDTLQLRDSSFHASADNVTIRVPEQLPPLQIVPSPAPSPSDIWWTTGLDPFFQPSEDPLERRFRQLNGATLTDITFTRTNPFIGVISLESVIVRAIPNVEIEVFAPDGLPAIVGASGFPLGLTDITVSAESQEGTFASGPVRVVYATHSTFQRMQELLEDGAERLICDDTLVRSFLPSLIDGTVSFRGSSTTEQLRSSFIQLISDAIRSDEEDEDLIKIDISNIIAALDEEGFTDAVGVTPEFIVTNFLSDGEFEVRYLNPSESTKQDLAHAEDALVGSTSVLLRRSKSTAAIPGRGRLFLGGNDPDRREELPYEAAVENPDGTITVVLRGDKVTEFDHNQWETATVSVRDYDPDLEFTDGTIRVPRTNRPYVRQLLVLKKG
jgi:hypothetical protein